MQVGLGPGHIVLGGDPAPLPKKGAVPPPQFSAHAYCGQTAGWIKMALGVEVGLGPFHIVLDGTQLPPQQDPQFLSISIAAKRLDASRCHSIWR